MATEVAGRPNDQRGDFGGVDVDHRNSSRECSPISLAGVLQTDDDSGQAAEERAEPQPCDHPICPEIIWLRLLLSVKDGNEDAATATIGEVVGCPWCSAALLGFMAAANVYHLDSSRPFWVPQAQAHHAPTS